MVDRRQFPRRSLSEEVQCYIDGVRFDARTVDLSAGGAFIRTTRWRTVSPGALVGLVFPRNRLSPQTTFLFGRVVRVQEGVMEGLALAWEKAVTVAPPEELARFLNATFGIVDPVIGAEASGPRREMRNVFHFESIAGQRLRPPSRPLVRPPQEPGPPPGDEPPPLPPRNGGPAPAAMPVEVELPDPFDAASLGAEGLQVRAEDLDALDLKIVAVESDGTRRRPAAAPEAPRPPSPAARPAPGAPAAPEAPAPAAEDPGQPLPGAMSMMVARDAHLPVALAGVLEAGTDRLALEVVRLGMEEALARTAFAPIDASAGVVLRFEIPARRGPVTVSCLCRDARVDHGPDGATPGLRLRFAEIHEGGSPGVLARYLKFLQFQDLARS